MLVENNIENVNYLNLNTIELYTVDIDKIAYLVDYKIGYDVSGKGFYKLYFKDANSRVVRGMIFDVDNFKDTGAEMSKLKGKPVSITYESTEFQGSVSLNIGKIEEHTGEFDLMTFIGVIPDVEEAFNYCDKIFTGLIKPNPKQLRKIYKTKSIPNIFEGKCGGYVKFLQIAVNELIVLNNLDGIDISDLLYAFFIVQEYYYKYLTDIEDKIDTKALKLNHLKEVMNKILDTRCYEVIVDSLASLYGLGEPEHLYTHIIVKSFQHAFNTIAKINMFNTLVDGYSKEYKLKGDEGILIKH